MKLKKPLTKKDSELLFELADYLSNRYEETSGGYWSDHNITELDDLFKKYID